MRRTGLLAALALTCGLAVAAPARAAEPVTDTATGLPMNDVRDVVVDEAHGHVYLTGGGTTGVVVRDLDGAHVAVVADQPNAQGMALSPDGTRLYVALAGANAISAIDTATLAEVARYPTGDNTCPLSLATHDSYVWFGYGCWQTDVGLLDLGGESPAVTLQKRPPDPATGTAWMELGAGGTRMVVATPGGGTVSSYTIDGTTLTHAATRQVGTELGDLALTPDGTKVLTASRTPYQHQRFLAGDLSLERTYGNFTYPVSVAVTGTRVAAGTNADYTTDIRISGSEGGWVREYRLTRRLVPHGLVFSPDGSRLYALTSAYGGSNLLLHVYYDPGKTASSITLTKPSTAKINSAYTVTGKLSSGAAGRTIHVSRSSAYGTVALPDVVTGTGGAFSFTDTVRKRGTYSYTATFYGDATHARTVRTLALPVTGLVPSLTIATNATTYGFHATATMTARLGPTSTSRVVRLSVQPHAYGVTVLRQQNVDSGGYVRASYTVTRRTVFTAYFAGDDLYEPRTVSVARGVHAGLTTSLAGYYATSGSYRLYRRSVDPVLDVYVQPRRFGSCTSYEAQRYSSGAWRTVATNSCIHLDSWSRAQAILVGTPTVGAPHRMRATFTGDASNLRTVGPWLYLKFT